MTGPDLASITFEKGCAGHGPFAVADQRARAVILTCSRNHCWAGSAVSRGCHAMKYEKPLISRGGSTKRRPAMDLVILANLRGRVRIKSVRAMARIVGTKYGTRSAVCRFRPSSARGRSRG